MDYVGLSSKALDRLLSSWDHSEGSKPRVLYTIPTGQNPTGKTQTTARRHEIYAVAVKHDLCIIEDDPYYFLQLSNRNSTAGNNRDREIEAYLESLPSSYLSIDTSGRVIRLDSVSKTLAPGLRCGWLTACSELVAKFLQHTEFSTVSPSGPSQVMLYKLLDQTWGHEGFLQWLIHLSMEYQRRRNILVQTCARYLSPDICSWEIPTAGMFLWLRIDWLKHSSASFGSHSDERAQVVRTIEDRIYVRARENGVQVSKGSWFRSTAAPAREMYFRLTFAAAPEFSLEDGVKILAKVIEAEFG
jgi:aromatic amino acid aminotransferase I